MKLIITTFPNLKVAKEVCTKLLEEKLVACVTYLKAESNYWWKGKVEKSPEVVVLLKTSEKVKRKVEQKLKEMHPYTLPEILSLRLKASKDFERWIKGVVE